MNNEAYCNWKHWEPSSFGALSRVDRRYFISELSRTPLPYPLPPHLRVLDIGFGNGSFLRFVQEQIKNIEGTEINDGLLQLARESGFIVHDQHYLAQAEPLSYDLVTAFDVLEHIQPVHIDQFLSSIYRTLNYDGLFLARFPNADSPFGLEAQNGDPSHVNCIGVGKIKYWACRHGFRIEYLGREAAPLLSGSLLLSLRRALTFPWSRSLDFIIEAVFLPGSGVCFSSRNTVCILRKPRSL